MARHRDLIVANLAGLLVLLVALLIGWWEAAAFGLAVLAILDLMVLLRGRQARADEIQTGEDESADAQSREESMTNDLPEITYEQARAAYEAGQKLFLGSRVFLVRRALREHEEGLVLWVVDERTLGDHGQLLFPDGRVKVR